MATATSSRRILVGPSDDGRSLTAEEYFRVEVELGYRCELARGVLEVTLIPAEAHRRLVYFFYKILGRYDDAHPGIIAVFGGSNEFHFRILDLSSGRNPDVAVELRGAARMVGGEKLASLAIEIVSPGQDVHQRDYVTKREEYLLYGLREYWIVDRFARKITVLIREEGSWIERVSQGIQTAEGHALPGFAVVLAELWASIDDIEGDPDENHPEAEA